MTAVVDPVWLPFPVDVLARHLVPRDGEVPLADWLAPVALHRDLAWRHEDRRRLSSSLLASQCAVEADPRFWTATTLLGLVYGSDPTVALSALLRRALPRLGVAWERELADLRLFLDVDLAPAPWRPSPSPVPFVREAGPSDGPVRVEAALLGESETVLFLARVTGDVLGPTTGDPLRDDLVRAVDAMLSPSGVLTGRDGRKASLVVLTPRLLREHPEARIYGARLERWAREPASLARDLPHRPAAAALAERIGWATFEEAEAIAPGLCPWFSLGERL